MAYKEISRQPNQTHTEASKGFLREKLSKIEPIDGLLVVAFIGAITMIDGFNKGQVTEASLGWTEFLLSTIIFSINKSKRSPVSPNKNISYK